ncbi:MAG: lytic transglycosylase domain-containing protein [Spirochaetaceae bacterium]|nr:MAG: lytic transglycosylase domain-containing protein [Spirochaetaceae bacterium]
MLIVLLTAFLGCSAGDSGLIEHERRTLYSLLFRWRAERHDRGRPDEFPNVLNLLESDTPMLTLYREDLTSEAVTQFFVEVTGSPETALPILYHADRNDLPLSLAFALTWVESRYSPVAVNRNATSVDRGLWQLNSLTFRHLSEEDFFDPDVSSRHGADYLRRSMRLAGGDQRTALAIYNAGLARVRRNQIPPTTQRYVRRVSEFQEDLEARFRRFMMDRFPVASI